MKAVILYTDTCEVISEVGGFRIPCEVHVCEGSSTITFSGSAVIPFAASSNQMRTAVVNQMITAAAGHGKALQAGDCTVVGAIS
jgi:hypothetical protein